MSNRCFCSDGPMASGDGEYLLTNETRGSSVSVLCLLAYKQGAGVSLLRRAHALAWQTRLDLQRNRHPRSLFSCPSLLYPFLLESFLKRKSDFGSGSSALPGSPGIRYQRTAASELDRSCCIQEPVLLVINMALFGSLASGICMFARSHVIQSRRQTARTCRVNIILLLVGSQYTRTYSCCSLLI